MIFQPKIRYGPLSSRPAPGIVDRYFYVTDPGQECLYRDNGTDWKYVHNIVPTATPTASSVPMSDGAGLLDLGWLGSGTPDATTTLFGDQVWRHVLGNSADVQLQRTDANTITLAGMPNTSKLIWVADAWIDLSTSLTIDTDSAYEYCITGTTTVSKGSALSSNTTAGSDGNAYNAYGLYSAYLCNNNACWNFSSYDRRGKLIVSPNSPTSDGYLAASGDGANARYLGPFCCGSSRTMENVVSIASLYNPYPRGYELAGTSDWTVLTPDSGWQDLPNSECQFHAVLLPNSIAYIYSVCRVKNDDTDTASISTQIYNGSTALGIFDAENFGMNTYGIRQLGSLRSATMVSATAGAVYFFKLRLVPTNGSQPNSSPQVRPVLSCLGIQTT